MTLVGGGAGSLTSGALTLARNQEVNNLSPSGGNVANLVNAMASFAPTASGQFTLAQATAASLNPIIAANWSV